ncbi:pentatricopeptide repeat-containing protein [Salix suchowensis]|nr:pentatricopeptide repeat-containing protein [Salix suchowensis]
MECSGVLAFLPSTPSKVRRSTSLSCSLHQSTPSIATTELENNSTDCSDNAPQKFSYSRASPSVRWPQLKLNEAYHSPPLTQFTEMSKDGILYHSSRTQLTEMSKDEILDVGSLELSDDGDDDDDGSQEEKLGWRQSRTRVKKMNKLALKRAKDWRERVKYLTDKILGLKQDQFVADVLDDRKVQMTPTDLCFVVKSVGQESWHRSLEVYEWLNLRHWYSPNARMVSTILSVLGKANQEALAVEVFMRAEPSAGNTVQVYNAMMGVYARRGKFNKVQELLELMHERGCKPDLVSFNTLINARLKLLLNEVRKSGLRPDIITYNTLISACSRALNLEEAAKVFDDMEAHHCQPDLWTYNAMISVYGRCGLSGKAEQLFNELESRGFFPDAVSYNSLLYAFAREGNVEKVKEIWEQMVKIGFGKDEMTYNTLIHMYGKQGQNDLALQLYRDMKSSGRNPDAVTYTVLIDSLGKTNKYALICGYAKAGKPVEAEETFDCMLRSGIRPDQLAYSVMLDIHLRFNEPKRAMALYKEMLHDGITLDHSLYELMVRTLRKVNKVEDIVRVIRDMEEICSMNPQTISSILVKGECYDEAAKMLRRAISDHFEIDRENLLSILSSYSSSGRHSEALDLLEYLKEHAPKSSQMITEALVVMLCKAQQLDAALREYSDNRELGFTGSFTMFESLIQCCLENELITEASQVFSDMRFCGVKASECLYKSMVLLYCKMGFPETAHHLIDFAEIDGIVLNNISLYVNVIEAYGRLKLWQKAEGVAGNLRQRCITVDRKVWNALIEAYAASGCYERARAIFNTMMRDGPSPTVNSINGLLQALIVGGRLDELYMVVQELQDMGFKISKSSILLMLDAFARAGNIFEVKKIYNGMKAAGYFPTMHLYRVMARLLCRGKQVRDVEAMLSEMEEAGFKPDLSIWNSVLKMFVAIEDFRKTTQVYKRIKEDGLEPDEDTYNTLIVMYCRDHRPEEGLSLMHEMRVEGLEPKLDTYKSLVASFGKQQLVEQAEELFEELQSKGCKLDRSFYHTMMKIYRNSGSHSKAERLFSMMKDAGKLIQMKKEGLEPDHRIWTCFIRAASLSQRTSEAIVLLDALRDAGFDLPIRLLKEKPESLISALDQCLEILETSEDNAAFNFVNALEDLLWAFELRATASWVFQLAIKRRIYRHDVFRVADKSWGADFRKLSGGAALVGLTLWLDHMQDASLQGCPESPKSVVLITGRTLKACLWEMGSPFLPCKSRSGLLIAKAHSLRMWLKDSPFCLDLELKNAPSLPESNSMQLIEGCFIRSGLVPAFKEINEKVGFVRPKKFAKFALLSDDRREKAIQAFIEGGKEKKEKMKKRGELGGKRNIKVTLRKRKFTRQAMPSNRGRLA